MRSTPSLSKWLPRFRLRTILFAVLIVSPVFVWLGNAIQGRNAEQFELARYQKTNGCEMVIQRGGDLRLLSVLM
ncbi:MAG: hypothetical protein AAF939_06300 [Planctomycetota bacterium]